MTPPNEVLQRNLSIQQGRNAKKQAEINRLWKVVERLTAEKAALLADLKKARGEA